MPRTTAQLRNAALEEEKALNWIKAAELQEKAAERHPGLRNPRGLGAMDKMDIEKLKSRAAANRRFAEQEAAA